MSTINYLDDYQIYDFFEATETITIFKDGKEKTFPNTSTEFDKIKTEFMDMIYNSYEMPAFGVSIHEHTMQALQSGTWVQFNFKEQLKHNDMPFDALLINVSPDYQGFNLIRQVNGKYEGRCFYINLDDGNMQKLYDLVEKTNI